MNLHDVIRRPLMTEKATLKREVSNQYFFEVDGHANKFQIRQAVEKLFKVKVIKICTLTMSGKEKRVGRFTGRTPDWKKAIVTLKAGDKIEFLTGTGS